MAQQIVRDAEKEGIPLVADVEQHRWSNPNILVRHYDFGKDLSLSEIRVIQQLCNVAASKCDAHLQFTLETLRFAVEAKPVAQTTQKGWRNSRAETDAAIAEYIQACRQHSQMSEIVQDDS